MSNRNDSDWVLWALVIAGLFLGLLVWKFSEALGLDIKSGASVLLRLIVTAALTGLCAWFGKDFEFLHLKSVWPILTVLFWLCWWPALDCWASSEVPFSSMRETYDLPWWDEWYTKWGVVAFLIGGWFGLRRVFGDRY
jgi:hypothetical protein